jgi:hypothetical protein
MKVTLKISLEIAEPFDEVLAERALDYAAQHLAANGLLTDENASLEDWSHAIEWPEDTER